MQEVVGCEHGRKKESFQKCRTGNWDARKRGDGLREGDRPGIEGRRKSQRPDGEDGSGFEGTKGREVKGCDRNVDRRVSVVPQVGREGEMRREIAGS